MKSICRKKWRRLRIAATFVVGLGVASAGMAFRVDGAGAPAASAVQSSPQQAAAAQTDESASLRQGTIVAVDERGTRLQVQGIWLDVVAGKTQLLRNGRPAGLETLKAGETIRFTLVSGSGLAPAMKVIYAP